MLNGLFHIDTCYYSIVNRDALSGRARKVTPFMSCLLPFCLSTEWNHGTTTVDKPNVFKKKSMIVILCITLRSWLLTLLKVRVGSQH